MDIYNARHIALFTKTVSELVNDCNSKRSGPVQRTESNLVPLSYSWHRLDSRDRRVSNPFKVNLPRA